MSELAEIISKNESKILAEWIRTMSAAVSRTDLMSKAEADEQCRALLNGIVAGVKTGGSTHVDGPGWNPVRETLRDIATIRARQGFSPIDVATFVLSLKLPLFASIREAQSKNQDLMFDTIWEATQLLDGLALL